MIYRPIPLFFLLVTALYSGTSYALTDGQNFQDWRAKCVPGDKQTAPTSERTCHIFQDLLHKDSGKRVLHMAIGYLPGQQPVTIIVTLPLGISIPPGITIRIDDKNSKTLAVQACFANGCQAAFQPDPAWLAALSKGLKAEVIFSNIQNQAISIPVSLKGITAGMKALKTDRK